MKLKSWTGKEKPFGRHSENKDVDDLNDDSDSGGVDDDASEKGGDYYNEKLADSRPFINSRWG